MTLDVQVSLVPGADQAYPSPVPASMTLPEWYRNFPTDVAGGGRTIKACVPYMEAMTAGFVLRLPNDIIVADLEGQRFVGHPFASSQEAHNMGQVAGSGLEQPYKFLSPWLIRTPPGVSCLFKQPEQRGLPFRILEGIVDTDTYPNPVNFPFMLEPTYAGIIPRGTPMAQVVPFRREPLHVELVPPPQGWTPTPAPVGEGVYRERWWHRRRKTT